MILWMALPVLMIANCCTPPVEDDFIHLVNPRIGSGGHGHVFVGASVPFGMVQLGPTSIPQTWDWCSGYHDSDSTVIGFSHTHLEGTGIGDLFDITVMPVIGDVTYARGTEPEPGAGPEEIAAAMQTGLWSYADRSREFCCPGYYSVPLTRYGILAELTATTRVGVHRYTFPASDSAALVFDLENGGCWDKVTDAGIEVVDSCSIQGYRYSSGWAKDQKVFFYARFSKPFESFEMHGKYGRANFRTSEDEKIVLQVAISPVDVEGARNNMAAETGLDTADFDEVAELAFIEWDREMSKIKIHTDDEDARKVFYTAFYHTMIDPATFSDRNGDYRGADGKIYRGSGFTNYTVLSLWDTYRAAMPLMTLVHPEKVDDMAATMLHIYEQQGKLPVWHLWGNETDCMVGNPGVIALADFLVKGFNCFNKELAYKALKDSEMNPERGQGYRMEYGFIPADKFESESVAFDMEYAIADGAMAQACKYLGKEEDYQYFTERSHSYRNYFDPQTQFIRGRNSDGNWVTPFNPYRSEHRSDVYCEGNAWQYTWLAPQDFEGLVALFGSREKFLERLDSLFAADSEIVGDDSSPDISGLIGQYAHGNEPSHHIIYFYTMAGQPWKTADLVRKVFSDFYFNDPNGLAGNEDAGQMSAWYLLSSLGFYQAEPAVPRFWFGSPAFREASVKVGHHTFTIKAKGLSETNRYIQSVTLNGKKHPYPYIEYKDICNGGTLVLKMGPKPAIWY
jgi:predicted alpha-1,2-mannosidase